MAVIRIAAILKPSSMADIWRLFGWLARFLTFGEKPPRYLKSYLKLSWKTAFMFLVEAKITFLGRALPSLQAINVAHSRLLDYSVFWGFAISETFRITWVSVNRGSTVSSISQFVNLGQATSQQR
ncbi:hypothetical protein AVEN_101424-1 [Araneus ventricosus]|uniref:Uncharacterized protein n=1 Tax=Araneus ventricosus TaxID=182803 RepID=A0A4Y2CUY1_ARAVE|nr:hypothetical protein AVEN_101424-1 [Araneus ventricosus]